MARRKSDASFLPLFLFLILVGAGGGYLFFFSDFFTASSESKKEQEPQIEQTVFSHLEEWVPEVVWEEPKPATKEIYYGVVKGVERTGTIVRREGSIDHFEDAGIITKLGFEEDLNLSADGPDASLWGYTKNVGESMQVVVLSYTNEDMVENSDGVLEPQCPCTLTLSVFVSDLFKPNWQELKD